MNKVTLFDTGAPRGKPNLWILKVNGKTIASRYGRNEPKELRILYYKLVAALLESEPETILYHYELAMTFWQGVYCDWEWRTSREIPNVPSSAVRNIQELIAKETQQ